MNKTGLIAILSTGIVVVLILVVSRFSNSNRQAVQATEKEVSGNALSKSTQTDSAADHHGGGAPVDTTIFNSLINKPAPDFTLESYDEKKITLSGLKGKNVILFFNEGLMCYPACWNQISAFGKDTQLQSKAVVLNITADSKNDWKQAIDKMPELVQSTVLFDSNRQISQKYGVLTLPSSMHRGQFPGHSYAIIDKEGIIKFVRDDVQMAVRNQELAAEVDKL